MKTFYSIGEVLSGRAAARRRVEALYAKLDTLAARIGSGARPTLTAEELSREIDVLASRRAY